MGQPSFQASNAIIYLTYAAFLIFGLFVAWRLWGQSKGDFLSANRTQKGIPLALNFIASALGSGIFYTYPQIATIAGVQGLVVYTLSSSLPLLLFAALGPIIRRKCPEGFVLTEWTRQRYGAVAGIFLSAMTLITLFLYMVSELSAMQQAVSTLTGIDAVPVVVVECVVTTIYTSLGGFKVSFITDNIQATMVILLVIIGTISIGVTTQIDRSLVENSPLLGESLLGWQLLYILPVAITTNDCFLSGFWMRTFASKTNKDLWIGSGLATFVTTIIIALVGVSGLLAVWSGAWTPDVGDEGYLAFFYLLEQLPSWVVGITLVMLVSLSTAAFDSIQSSMVSTGSNDLFRNKLPLIWIRVAVVLVMVPAIVVALRSPDILQIYLITDLVSAAVIPVLFIGLWGKMYWWRGFEVVVGGLGGILTVFIFGTIYYGNARDGAYLILLENGLYADDWGAFGAFVAAPFGGLIFAVVACALRLTVLWIKAKIQGTRFDALDKPIENSIYRAGDSERDRNNVSSEEYEAEVVHESVRAGSSGKFF